MGAEHQSRRARGESAASAALPWYSARRDHRLLIFPASQLGRLTTNCVILYIRCLDYLTNNRQNSIRLPHSHGPFSSPVGFAPLRFGHLSHPCAAATEAPASPVAPLPPLLTTGAAMRTACAARRPPAVRRPRRMPGRQRAAPNMFRGAQLPASLATRTRALLLTSPRSSLGCSQSAAGGGQHFLPRPPRPPQVFRPLQLQRDQRPRAPRRAARFPPGSSSSRTSTSTSSSSSSSFCSNAPPPASNARAPDRRPPSRAGASAAATAARCLRPHALPRLTRLLVRAQVPRLRRARRARAQRRARRWPCAGRRGARRCAARAACRNFRRKTCVCRNWHVCV